MLKVGSISTLAPKGRVLGLFCSLLYCCGQHNAQHVVALDNYLLSEWVNEWVSKRDMLCVHSSSMVSGVTEQALCALALTVLSSQSWTKAFIKAVSLKHIYCHSFTAASTQVSDLLLSFLPPLEPSRSKSVNLEVDEDKSTKKVPFPPPPSSPHSEVAIGLSPYTLPQERPFHVPEDENIVRAGVCLAGPLHSRLLGSSVRLDNMPVLLIDKRSLKHQQSPLDHNTKLQGPPKKTNWELSWKPANRVLVS